MGKQSRLLCLLHILKEETDQDHPLTTYDLIGRLSERGFSVHRTTLATDMEHLLEAGYDVVVIRSNPKSYFLGDRYLEQIELKMLADIIGSAQFLTPAKGKALVSKLGQLTSRHVRPTLKRKMYSTHQDKNEKIYYILDTVQTAISQKKVLTFQYWQYGPDKKLHYRHDGQWYHFSPYATVWNNDRYYVVGYSESHQKDISFRIDRMTNTKILDEIAKVPPSGFFRNQNLFEMFEGVGTTVELLCDNSMMDVIVDRFGRKVLTQQVDDSHFLATPQITISARFYSWLFGFGGAIKLVGPASAVAAYQKLGKASIEEYAVDHVFTES